MADFEVCFKMRFSFSKMVLNSGRFHCRILYCTIAPRESEERLPFPENHTHLPKTTPLHGYVFICKLC